MTVYIPNTYGDIQQICFQRGRIANEVQERDAELIQSAINEYYIRISTERSWHWRKFYRSFPMSPAVTTGTSSTTNGSRDVTLSGITVDDTYLTKSIRFNGEKELYRIIGVDVANNKVFLESAYVGTTNASATHQIYKYEFALPPDVDTLEQVYIETGGVNAQMGGPGGDLEDLNPEEFNQLLAISNQYVGIPAAYTRDGDTPIEDLVPLDEMILDYDFLAGDKYERISRLRIWPIAPDAQRVIHLNYSKMVEPLKKDEDKPIMPIDDRWIIIHYTMGEWWKHRGEAGMADREFKTGDKMLAEMRQEFHKTDSKPKIVVDRRRYRRHHFTDDRRWLHWISRQAETGGA